MREAYSLLKQSIIHVEKDDVEIDEDEDDEDGHGGDAPNGDGPSARQRATDIPSSPPREPTPVEQAPPPKKKKVVVSYDKYMAIANLLNTYLSSVERDTGSGLARSEVVQWYLEQREADIGSLEELEEEQTLIDKVLKKLVKEKQLLELRGDIESREGEEEAQQENEDEADPVLMGESCSDADQRCPS